MAKNRTIVQLHKIAKTAPKCTLAEACDCTTIDEWLHVSIDSRLDAVEKELCSVGKEVAAEQNDDDQDTGDHWDDEESVVSTDENEYQECDSDVDSSLHEVVDVVVEDVVEGYDFDVDSVLKEVVDETKEDMVEGNKGNVCVMIAKTNDNISVHSNDLAGGRFLIFSPKKTPLMSKEETMQLL